MLQGVAQPVGDADHHSRGLDRLDLLPVADELSQILPLDKLHHQEVASSLGEDFVNRDDVRVAEHAAQAALADKQARLDRVLAEPAAQDLDGDDFPRLAVRGSKYPSERAVPHQIEDPVVAEEVAGPVAFQQLLGLIIGQVLVTDEKLDELVQPDLMGAQRRPRSLAISARRAVRDRSAHCAIFSAVGSSPCRSRL